MAGTATMYTAYRSGGWVAHQGHYQFPCDRFLTEYVRELHPIRAESCRL